MTDPNSPSHWDLLASDLGATPPPQEAEPRQPSPPPSQPSLPRKPASREAHRGRSATASPRTADWDVLASELGLASAPQPVAPPPIVAAAPSVVAPPPLPPLPEQGRRGSTPPELPESPEESPNFFDERFDFEEPFDLLESPAAGAETPDQTTEPKEKRRRKRRPRRRRGRGSETRDSHDANAPAEAKVRSADAGPTSAEEPDTGEMETGDAKQPHDEAEAGERQDRRPRRRRPRRGRNRGDGESRGGEADRPQDAQDSPVSEKSHDMDTVEADELVGEGIDFGEGAEDGDQPARLGFRGIPTWDEVVGMMVEKNIEARSRRPAGGPHHGRGNRGSRDNRGGHSGKPRS